MVKAITLDCITYKDKWYAIESKIDVDEKDVYKLEKIGAIRSLEAIPEKKTEVKINVIKNPIKTQKRVEKIFDEFEDEDIKLPSKTAEKIYKENKKIKRKYNRRKNVFKKRR